MGNYPKAVPLDFTEDDVTWVASKLSGAAGALGAEAIELRNWILCFGCASEELRVVVVRLADWMANSSPPWAAYRALMACRLVVLDKRSGVRPVGIGKTLRWALAKLVIRAAGDQAKTECGNLQLSIGLKASIEGATHAICHCRFELVRARRREKVAVDGESDEEEESGRIEATLNNLTTETAGAKEDVE